jgi:tRNA (guanine-N7-)-methyltransferase
LVELIPETYLAPLDLDSIFGRVAPLRVDLGCGDGSFLCELAQRNPENNFLGVDKLAGRVAKACRKAALLSHIRILKVESSYAVRYLLPAASVSHFYLLFPDPWPKRRHHRRRLVTADFLDSIQRALEPNGSILIATDDQHYFNEIVRTARNHNGFVALAGDDIELPASKFETRFRAAGSVIYRLLLRKVSPVK